MKAVTDRRLVAIVCTLFMAMLGTVYAWSYFQKPLCDTFLWSNSQVAWAFSLAICCLGISAAAGGLLIRRFGPTRLAMIGGLLHGSGYLLSALALGYRSLPLLYLGYGIVGGVGLGLGYVTPVATVARWFPDRKGFATGMVVMGFGFGALLMSKLIAPGLLLAGRDDLQFVFASVGAIFVLATMLLAGKIVNPPEGWLPAGFTMPTASAEATVARPSISDSLFSPQFVILWLVFFCNITAGIAIIGFQSPLFQDISRSAATLIDHSTLASRGATLIAISSIFNGAGRLFWAALSDRIGRKMTFATIITTQMVTFIFLMQVKIPWLFAMLVCYVLLCYGGGFGTMPSFILDKYGATLMPPIYGAILTAWSAAGVLGPQLVAMLKDRYPAELHPGVAAHWSFALAAAMLALGLLLTSFIRNDRSGVQ